MRGGRFQLALAVALALALASACSAGDDRTSYPLPDDGWRSGDGVLLARPNGEFYARLTPHGACAWMGDPTSPYSFRWPSGFRVRFHPTQLIDPSGRVIATEGEVIHSGGGFTGQTAGGKGEPTKPIVRTWCGRPGEPVFAVQGAVEKGG